MTVRQVDAANGTITVFPARRIVTMDRGRPTAQAVAVKDGRVLSVGTLASMQPWLQRQPYVVDDTFRDKVVLPGFIDPHTHFGMSGAFLGLHYVGPIDSPGPGGINPALESRAAVLAHLRRLHESTPDPLRPLFAWGFDPALQGGQLHRDELDAISRERPIWVLSYAPHFVYTNSPMLQRLGATAEMTLHGLGRDADGRLNGRFVEVIFNF
jgi:hypothetical protein